MTVGYFKVIMHWTEFNIFSSIFIFNSVKYHCQRFVEIFLPLVIVSTRKRETERARGEWTCRSIGRHRRRSRQCSHHDHYTSEHTTHRRRRHQSPSHLPPTTMMMMMMMMMYRILALTMSRLFPVSTETSSHWTNKKHLKNFGPIRHCEPPHAACFTLPFTSCRYCRTPALSHAACASMSTTTTTTTTTTTRDRGDRYGPIEWAQ